MAEALLASKPRQRKDEAARSSPAGARHESLEQRPAARSEAALRGHLETRAPAGPVPVQRSARPNRTGLPDRLKSGVEALSGLSMDDVRVHRNSPRPAQLNAHAYAQGRDIHLAPGQDRHLPHEAWHLVQQAQGRVKPTLQAKGAAINDDAGLEREADAMGDRALSTVGEARGRRSLRAPDGPGPIQAVWVEKGEQLWKWDQIVSGVVWFTDGHYYWFEVKTPEGDVHRPLSGQGNKRTHDEWLKLGVQPLDEEEVFTDSGSDSDDPHTSGFRLTEKKNDKAEFDRIKIKRRKLYEDKTASFDQSKAPEDKRRPRNELIEAFIKKQILTGISNKINVVIKSYEGGLGVREGEKTGMSGQQILDWLQEVKDFKIVVFGTGEDLKQALSEAVLKLRASYPDWKITAKLGDPKAKEDSDRMHK